MEGNANIINSLEEWSEIFGSQDEKYDKKFFGKNSLIVYGSMRSTQGTEMDVAKIQKNKNELLVELNVRPGYMDALGGYTINIEVKKSDMKNINSLRIVEILEN